MAAKPSVTDGCWDKVNVSDVEDASSFTVKLAGSETEFNSMMGEIQKSSSSSAPPSSAPDVGSLVVAQFSFDNQWYRAEVKKINTDGTLEVRYIDYGNLETVSRSNTRIDRTAEKMPCQGIQCRLNRIDYSTPINKQHHEAFRTMCLNQTFTACFVTKDPADGDHWCIELFHTTGNVNDWFGKITGRLTTPKIPNSSIPAKLPHPHNIGLIAYQPSSEPASATSSAASTPARPLQADTVPKRAVPGSFQGTVVFVNNPSEFWVQIDSDMDAVMDICAKLAIYCNSESCKRLGSPAVGQLCAALYSEDKTWYRGQVIEVQASQAKIFFIDYGNTEMVDFKDIVVIPASLQREPGFAIETCLNGVTSTGTIWSEGATAKFSELVMDSPYQIDVIGTIKTHTKLVNMTLNGSSLGAKLVQAGVAKPAKPTTASPVRVPVPSRQPPVTSVPQAPSSAGSAQQGYNMQVVESGQREMVYVSWLLHPATFWVQKEGCEDLLANLLDSAKECAGQSSCMSNPAVGMPCVAKYSADNNWYRGEITSCMESSCTVVFIDYGNSEDISKQDIYPASSSLIEIPCQAFKCTLLGVSPHPGAEWSDESHDKMEELLSEGGMCTFLARRGDSYLVEMTYNGEASLQEALVQNGVAKLTRTNSQVSHSSQGSHRSASSVGNVSKHLTSRASPAPPSVDGAGDRRDSLSADKPYIKPANYINLGVAKNSEIEGHLVNVENTQMLYVQLAKYKNEMDSMYDKMGEMCNNGKLKPVQEVVIGYSYAVQFSQDNEWYRARVDKKDGSKFEVYFLDYGNTEMTSVERMRMLEPEFCKLPGQAFCCKLYNYNQVLSKEQMVEFCTNYTFADITGVVQNADENIAEVEMLCDGEPVSAIITSTCSSAVSTPQRPTQHTEYPKLSIQPGDFAGYVVYDDKEQSVFYIQKTLDTELIEQVAADVDALSQTEGAVASPAVGQACIAKFSDDEIWYRAEILTCSAQSVSVRFIDYGNSADVIITDLKHVDDNLSKIPPLAIPCQHAASTAGLNLTDWAVDEITVTVKSVNDGKALVVLKNASGESFGTSDSIRPAPQAKQVDLKAAAKACYELGEFQGYLAHEISQLEFYIQKTADTELVEQVTEKVSAESTNSPLTAPAEGQLCIAMYKDELDDEGAWYRALIVSVKDVNAEVFFIDFGNSSSVDKKELLTISDALGEIPPLAVRCKLPREDKQKNLTEWAADEITVKVCDIDDKAVVVSLINSAGDSFLTESGANSIIATPVTSPPKSTPAAPATQPVLKIAAQQCQVGPFNGYLSHEVSQQEFYVQRTSDTELLDSVTTRVQDQSASPQIISPVISQACIAKFRDDGAWYRAEITAISDTEVQVLFVDFGNSSSVDRGDILVISEELSKIPAIAVPCKLTTQAPDQSLTDWAADEITVNIAELTDQLASVSLSTVDGQPFIAESTTTTITQASPARPSSQPVLNYAPQAINVEEWPGYLTVEVSQEEFYVQKTADTELLEQVTQSVAEQGERNSVITDPAVGQACIAKFRDDGLWYRAEIKSVSADSALVMFVDFGNCSDVDRSEIREIDAALAKTPAIAVPCRLSAEAPGQNLTDWAQGVEETREEIIVSVKQVIKAVAVVTLTNTAGQVFGSQPVVNGVASSLPSTPSVSSLQASPQQSASAQGSVTDTPQRSAAASLHGSAASSPGRPVLYHIPEASLSTGEHKAYVSHLEGPECIYLQLSSSTDMLNEILEKLDVNGPLAEPEVYCPVGQACIGVYSIDGNWYRAVVIESQEGHGTSTVLFVDYGTTEKVTNSSLKVLPPALRSQPRLAFKCNSQQESILKMPKEFFAEQVDSKELTVIIEGDSEPYSILIPELDEVADLSSSSQLITNTHVESSSFKYEVTDTAISSDDISMTVCHIVTPSAFYCQFSTGELSRIEELLAQNYTESQISAAVTLSDSELTLDTACVLHTKDSKFCRGLIKSAAASDQQLYKVQLVDYGNAEMVPASSIHPLHVACSDIAVQAVKCCLSGVYPLSGSVWDDDAISRFYELANKKQLTGRILASHVIEGSKTYLVSLTCSGELVTETLINAGFCSKIPVSAKPITEFCKELCHEIKAKSVSGSENKSTFLADRMNEFVKRLSSVLHEQLDEMKVDIMSQCTAQDIVYFISQQILCDLLGMTNTPDHIPTVCDKDSMRVEMQNIIGELLEEVMRVTSEIVDSMCDDALLAIDSIGKVEQVSADEPELVRDEPEPAIEELETAGEESAAELSVIDEESAEPSVADEETEESAITEITEEIEQLDVGAEVEVTTTPASDSEPTGQTEAETVSEEATQQVLDEDQQIPAVNTGEEESFAVETASSGAPAEADTAEETAVEKETVSDTTECTDETDEGRGLLTKEKPVEGDPTQEDIEKSQSDDSTTNETNGSEAVVDSPKKAVNVPTNMEENSEQMNGTSDTNGE